MRSLKVNFSNSLMVMAAAIALTGCAAGDDSEDKGRPTPTVGFVVARSSDVAAITELSGRVTAFQSSEVRPQVAGIVRRRLFSEGSLVRAGQPLYEIEPSLYRAAVNEAQANLSSAQATSEAARIRADRYRPLAEQQAVSQQDYTDALAQSRQASAAVAQNRARLDTARINLGFTRVLAPISGRIGRSLFTEGALVTTNQADPLAVIQRQDPVLVDIQQSGADVIGLRRALSRGDEVASAAEVRLILEDGSEYGFSGRIQFTEAVVNASTGTVNLRARFPNPQGLLLPGMFVRARFSQAVDRGAILVPQPAVSRDPTGNATVWVIGAGNKVEQRRVTAPRTSGANWVVAEGLAPGDRIVVEGTANLKPAAVVRPVPASQSQRIAPPAPGTTPAQRGR